MLSGDTSILEFFSIYRLYTAYYAAAASLFSHANLISFLDQGEDHQNLLGKPLVCFFKLHLFCVYLWYSNADI